MKSRTRKLTHNKIRKITAILSAVLYFSYIVLGIILALNQPIHVVILLMLLLLGLFIFFAFLIYHMLLLMAGLHKHTKNQLK